MVVQRIQQTGQSFPVMLAQQSWWPDVDHTPSLPDRQRLERLLRQGEQLPSFRQASVNMGAEFRELGLTLDRLGCADVWTSLREVERVFQMATELQRRRRVLNTAAALAMSTQRQVSETRIDWQSATSALNEARREQEPVRLLESALRRWARATPASPLQLRLERLIGRKRASLYGDREDVPLDLTGLSGWLARGRHEPQRLAVEERWQAALTAYTTSSFEEAEAKAAWEGVCGEWATWLSTTPHAARFQRCSELQLQQLGEVSALPARLRAAVEATRHLRIWRGRVDAALGSTPARTDQERLDRLNALLSSPIVDVPVWPETPTIEIETGSLLPPDWLIPGAADLPPAGLVTPFPLLDWEHTLVPVVLPERRPVGKRQQVRARAEREAARISADYDWAAGFDALADALDRERWGQLRVSIEREIQNGMTPDEFQSALALRTFTNACVHLMTYPHGWRQESFWQTGPLSWSVTLRLVRCLPGACEEETALFVERLVAVCLDQDASADFGSWNERLHHRLDQCPHGWDADVWLCGLEGGRC
jgi:hypothetical protein